MRSLNITRCSGRPYRFQPPYCNEGYALLLYIAASDVTSEEQTKISEEIVASGCRYAVCYGHHCSTWDDSIDLASIKNGKKEGKFVMTTWHEQDTPEDVAHFFWWNTSFDDFTAERMGIFVLGSRSQIESEIEHEVSKLNEPKKGDPVGTDNDRAAPGRV